MSDKPGLVDMAIRQMNNCGFNLPDWQANFFWGGGGNSNYILKHCMANFFNEISVYQKLFLKLI